MSRTRVILDVSPATLRVWQRAAKQSGLSLSAWIRLQCAMMLAEPRLAVIKKAGAK